MRPAANHPIVGELVVCGCVKAPQHFRLGVACLNVAKHFQVLHYCLARSYLPAPPPGLAPRHTIVACNWSTAAQPTFIKPCYSPSQMKAEAVNRRRVRQHQSSMAAFWDTTFPVKAQWNPLVPMHAVLRTTFRV